jgi:DNA repair protein RecO (recombination protein O)
MSLYLVEGIVLRVREFGEADKILVIYTRELGKIDVLAKGARRMKSRLAAFTQQFSYGQFSLYRGKGMFQLGQAEGKGNFFIVNGNIDRLAYASYLCELTEKFVPAEESQPEILYHLLAALERVCQRKDFRLPVLFFELKLVTVLGYGPILDRCLNCGQQSFQGGLFFSPQQGGTVCFQCNASEGGKAKPISPQGIAVLSRLQNTDWERLDVLKLSEEAAKEIKVHLSAYIDCRLERRLKTVDFINHLEKANSFK